MSIESDEREFKKQVAKTVDNIVDLGDLEVEGELYTLIERVGMLASAFGMGACKSFTEFKEMVDNEDPILINGLLLFISCQNRRMFGDPDDKPKGGRGNRRPPPKPSVDPDDDEKTYVRHKPYVENRETNLFNFVAEHGHNKAEIQKIREQVKNGEAPVPGRDFAVTPEELKTMSEAEFRGLLKDMNDYASKVPNYKLNLSKWNPS